MSLHIADYGRGLPDGFNENLHDVFDEPPLGAVVGNTYKDYGRMIAVRFVQFGSGISVTANQGMGVLFDTGRKVLGGTTTDGTNAGKRGAKELVVTVASGDTIAKDDFARGVALVTSGNNAPRRIYITGNTAKDSNHRTTLTFEEALTADFSTSDTVVLIGHKYSAVAVGAADDKLSAGFCLSRSPAASKYGYVQCGGVGVGRAGAAIATAAQDGTPLVKDAGGEIQLQADTDLKNVIATLIKETDPVAIADNDLIPIEINMGYDL